eukprot:TRINITY_DN4625_c0_g1_i1.p1 TRINITY_DN4625_c0_g1~~TRINITY_DN4625_c0_g1_i1.p1  ORF type:complete len:288 (-),score=74.69 TRINITY_DN4625_c0_g1_i1:253-1116(-)
MSFVSPLSSTNDDYPLSDSELETDEDATEDEYDGRSSLEINYMCVCGKRIDLTQVMKEERMHRKQTETLLQNASQKMHELVYQKNSYEERLQYMEIENDNLKRSLRVERNIRKDFEESYHKLLQKHKEMAEQLHQLQQNIQQMTAQQQQQQQQIQQQQNLQSQPQQQQRARSPLLSNTASKTPPKTPPLLKLKSRSGAVQLIRSQTEPGLPVGLNSKSISLPSLPSTTAVPTSSPSSSPPPTAFTSSSASCTIETIDSNTTRATTMTTTTHVQFKSLKSFWERSAVA